MRKLQFIVITTLLVYLFAELVFRGFLSATTEATFTRPSDAIYSYYPSVLPLKQKQISSSDSMLDILILSCSVLHPEWGNIEKEIESQIRLPVGYTQVKVHNVSGIGHSSYDNRIKYSLIQEKLFDAVVYYDAINDARLNNCPESVFRDDYSHYQWYDEINTLLSHTEVDITVLPYAFALLMIKVKALFVKNAYIPVHYSINPDWLKYGSDFKSQECFVNHFREMINLSEKTKTRFVYIPFLYYSPATYSLDKFKQRKLDYSFSPNSRETEIWGHPENVTRFIKSVNHEGIELIAANRSTYCVDFTEKFQSNGSNFADICHFSPDGLTQFANFLCRGLESLFEKEEPHDTSSSL